MKKILSGALALTLLLGTTGLASADSYRGNNDSYNRNGQYDRYDNGHHRDWRAGQRVDRAEYNRWERVDYRRAHLNRPHRGYEWRRTSDGRYVEIAIATGLIAAILSAH